MKIRKTTHILFISLIIVIVFSSSLNNKFAWDDEYLIINNPYVKSWSFLPNIFTNHLYKGSEMDSNFYRPLQSVSFIIDYSIWRLNPFGYHLTSLLLHIFNSALVYLIVITISSSALIAFLTALMFGISPVISGVTYYIPARADLLMALFVFLSILCFVRYREKDKKIFYIISIVSFALSLLCKEMAMILPMLLLLTLTPTLSHKWERGFTPRRWRWLLPYIVILLIYIFLRATILNFIKGPSRFIDYSFPATIPLWRRILTDFNVIVTYIRLLLFPFPLCMQRFIKPAGTIFQIDVLVSIASLIFIFFAIKKISHKNRLILFGSLWFSITLLPILNIYPISVFLHDMWLYVPSVGFFIIFGVIFQDIIRPRLGKILSNIIIVLFFTYYAFFTINYGKAWEDSFSLYHNVIKYGDENSFIYRIYDNLAIAHHNKGEFEKSIEYCRKSIMSNAKHPEVYNNLGITYMAMNKPARAIKFFKKASKLKKDDTAIYCNLGHAYSKIGLINKAIEISKAAIHIDPNSYKAYCNLGDVYAKAGDVDKAIEVFKKARELKKDNVEPYYCMGNLYMKKGNYKEAMEVYNKALEYREEADFNFYNALALVYMKNNKYKEAELSLMESLILNSNQCEPHNNLGNLYSMFGHFDLAIKEYKKALKIEPGNTRVLNNIEKTKRQWIQALKKSSMLDAKR